MQIDDAAIKVCGYAASRAKEPLTPYSFERRALRDNDLLIDIKYCGICHSDIHQVRDEWGGSIFPMVPGHEIVGIVSQVGAKTTRYKVGDKVGVGCFVDSCRKCVPCKKGLEQYCLEGATLTYNDLEKNSDNKTQGGYSNKIVVNEEYVPEFLKIFLWKMPHLFYVLVSRFILLYYIGKQGLERRLQ